MRLWELNIPPETRNLIITPWRERCLGYLSYFLLNFVTFFFWKEMYVGVGKYPRLRPYVKYTPWHLTICKIRQGHVVGVIVVSSLSIDISVHRFIFSLHRSSLFTKSISRCSTKMVTAVFTSMSPSLTTCPTYNNSVLCISKTSVPLAAISIADGLQASLENLGKRTRQMCTSSA